MALREISDTDAARRVWLDASNPAREATCRARWRATTMSSGWLRATVRTGHSIVSALPNDHRRIISAAPVITIQHAGNQQRVQSEQTRMILRRPRGSEAVRIHHKNGPVVKRIEKIL